MADLLVNLYNMQFRDDTARMQKEGVIVKRAFVTDKPVILEFIRKHFSSSAWVYECEYALAACPVSCYVAVHNKQIVGFACYDTSAKGFFGPTGVDERFRRKGIGAQLMMRCLWSMRESGYGYAVIGWAAEDAVDFYIKQTGAVPIPDSSQEKSVYRNMISME